MGNINSKSNNSKSKYASNPPREKTKRITVDVSASMHKALKLRAAAEGTTVSEILRSHLLKSLEEWNRSHKNPFLS